MIDTNIEYGIAEHKSSSKIKIDQPIFNESQEGFSGFDLFLIVFLSISVLLVFN